MINQIILDLVKLEYIFLKTMPWNPQKTETIYMHRRSNICGHLFYIFMKEISYAYCIDLIKIQQNSNIVK